MFTSHHLSSARFADKPEDFAKLGIQPGRIEAFEDGMRTEGGPGGYEWWYFDSHLHDGSSWRPAVAKWLTQRRVPIGTD